MKKKTRNAVAALGVAGLMSLGLAVAPAHASTPKAQTTAAATADYLLSVCITINGVLPRTCIVI